MRFGNLAVMFVDCSSAFWLGMGLQLKT
ncbi:hypothetical protein CABS01_08268 [Colletotrichum abscissum]|nr:hypothetical protein CABS01_08268 [Colletotrichum abscissum]